MRRVAELIDSTQRTNYDMVSPGTKGSAPFSKSAGAGVRRDPFGELRATEFSRLDAGGHVYLDHTGSALYPESVVRAHCESLRATVWDNPPPRNPTARASTQLV